MTKQCSRCGASDEIAKTGVYGYKRLCIHCFLVILYGPENNTDPLETTDSENTSLEKFCNA